jgi:hypothetical protein
MVPGSDCDRRRFVKRLEHVARWTVGLAPERVQVRIKQSARRVGIARSSTVPSARSLDSLSGRLLVPVGGTSSVPPLSGVVLCPMARYHTEELIPLADSLSEMGMRPSFLVHPRDAADLIDEMGGGSYPLYEWPDRLHSLPTFDAVVVMNDWGYTKDLVQLAAERDRPSFAKVEGVQDFCDDDTGRWRHAYHRAAHVLCQGDNDVEALRPATTHVVGSTRLERIYLAAEREFGATRQVVANSNFTYGVLTDVRSSWLQSVADAAAGARADILISQHHADRALAKQYPIARAPMKELLATTADVLVSRFSTVPFEAMARGVPFIYHNPHGERVPTFADPDEAFDVTTSTESLTEALQSALEQRGSYRSRSSSFFERQVDIDPDRPSESRTAAVIADVIRRSRAINAPIRDRP